MSNPHRTEVVIVDWSVRRLALCLAVGFVGVLLGCGSDSTEEPPPPANRAPTITISHGDLRTALVEGDLVQITADVTDADGDDLTVTWEVSGTGTLDTDTGLQVEWTAGADPGETTITATVSDGEATRDDDLQFTVGTLVEDLTIANGTTWVPAESPYIVRDDLLVPAGAVMTISAGTSVVFQGDFDPVSAAYDKPVFEVQGTLTVDGQAGGFPSLGVTMSGGRILGTGVQQHAGINFLGTGSGTMTYTTIRDGDVAVANGGTGALSMFRCTFTDNVSGYTGTGDRSPAAPVTLRACRINNNSGNGVFVEGDHVRVVDSNIESNLGWGVSVTSNQEFTSADADSCVVRSNESGNVRLTNISFFPFSVAIQACNLDQPNSGITAAFVGCFANNTIDLTGNYWLQSAGTTANVLSTMDNWDACAPELADWEMDVDWKSTPVLGAGI